MTWVKLDDQFADHPKVLMAGPLASWLYVCGLTYCSRLLTDGFIPTAQVRRLADVDNAQELANKLVEVGLWDIVDNGFQIHDYLQYNPTAESIKSRQESDRIRKNSARNPSGIQVESERNFYVDPVVDPVPEEIPNITPSATFSREQKKVEKVSLEDETSIDPLKVIAHAAAQRAGLQKFSADSWLRVVERYQSHVRDPDLLTEIDKAREWLDRNNDDSHKKKRVMSLAFLDNWLKKAVAYEEASHDRQSQKNQSARIPGGSSETHRGIFQAPAKTPYPGSAEYWAERQRRKAAGQQNT